MYEEVCLLDYIHKVGIWYHLLTLQFAMLCFFADQLLLDQVYETTVSVQYLRSI